MGISKNSEGCGLEAAVTGLREALGEDPRIEGFQGRTGPRDLLFSERVVSWIGRLTASPGDFLLLAAWGHTLKRWEIPRESYPMTTVGYHQWRNAQSALSADETEKILREKGCDAETVRKVRDLILKTHFPGDPDSQLLEDGDCLAFLELKLESYRRQWEGEGKMDRILKGTLAKMSPQAREIAGKLIS